MSNDGPVGVRSALIPDPFVTAFEERPDLGEISGNILLVADDVLAGRYIINGPGGAKFTLHVLEAA